MTKSNNTQKYVNIVNRLVAAGYPRDRALACVYSAFGLSPEALAKVQAEVAA